MPKMDKGGVYGDDLKTIHCLPKVNDSFTKAVFIVRISCEFCPDFMLILSGFIANVVHIKIESCPLFMRLLSASE